MSMKSIVKPRHCSRIKDVWGSFISDLNFRRHPATSKQFGAINMPGDFPQLTPEKLVEWYKSITAYKFAWCWIRWQSGHAAFPSKVLPRMEKLSADFFERRCELSKAEGMYVCGYTCGGDDVYAFQKHPEWFHECGHFYACLNAPFWDREFEAIQEALNIFPCDGLFYDMVIFTGKCRCEFCQAAYKRFYGEKMPEEYDTNKFRFDTFKRWAKRATQVAREIVPAIEICVNQQYLPSGVPYELLEHFDWYYCEFGDFEWIGEILRAWGDKPLFSGNAINPRHVAHLLGRCIRPLAYDSFTDYRTGKFISVDDRRVKPIKRVLGEIRKREPYLKDALPIPHTTVLFTSPYNLSKVSTDESYRRFLLSEEKYTEIVTTYVRETTRMNLSCCNVEVAERLTEEKLNRYEVVFAPELAWINRNTVALLRGWVERGGILFVSGLFNLLNEHKEVLQDFADNGLLGVRKVEGPLDTFAVLTNFKFNGAFEQMQELVAIYDAIVCESKGAEPVVFGNVGAQDNIPLIWQHKIGSGIVFFLAGRIGKRLEEDTEKCERSLRNCLQKLLFSYIKRAPFKTSTEYPTEVWLNAQPTKRQLTLHMVAYERPLCNVNLSIRADLIARNNIEIVYPVKRKAILKGKRVRNYVHFTLPEVHEHVIFTTKSESSDILTK